MKIAIPGAIETACFRVAQEAITNVMRHAQASRLEVRLDIDAQAITLRVCDDGSGFNTVDVRQRAVQGGSLGRLGMEERVLLVGGTFKIHSSPGQGAQIEVCIPLHGPADQAGHQGTPSNISSNGTGLKATHT